MKNIKEIKGGIFQIESEPGDSTHYSYFVFSYYDYYMFMPCESTFRYPQRLNRYNVQNLSEEELIKMALNERCNVWTLKECIRTIEEMIQKENTK